MSGFTGNWWIGLTLLHTLFTSGNNSGFSGFGGGQKASRKNTENRQQALDTRPSHGSNTGRSDERRKRGVVSKRLCVRSHPGATGGMEWSTQPFQ